MIIGGIFSGIADWWSGLFGEGNADPKTVTKNLTRLWELSAISRCVQLDL